MKILSIDLEGTLISNTVTAKVRPGLADFLHWVFTRFDKIVIFSAASEADSRSCLKELAGKNGIPLRFADMHIVHWSRMDKKDLRAVPVSLYQSNEIRKDQFDSLYSDISSILLVDDIEMFVIPEQRGQWVPIETYARPFDPDDRELERVKNDLDLRLDLWTKKEQAK